MSAPDSQTIANAEQGDPSAQFALGSFYLGGSRQIRDFDKAVHWFGLAAAQGHPDAQNNLGQLLLMDGAHYDFATAVGWLRRAAAQGQVDAEDTLEIIRASERSG